MPPAVAEQDLARGSLLVAWLLWELASGMLFGNWEKLGVVNPSDWALVCAGTACSASGMSDLAFAHSHLNY